MKFSKLEQNLPQLKKFIKENAPDLYERFEPDMDKYLGYFARIHRLFIVHDKKGRILGAACGHMVSDPYSVMDSTEIKDEPDGKVLFVWAIVVHKKLRHLNVMGAMLKQWLTLFPQIEYLMFKRELKHNLWKLIPIDRILRR